MSNAAFSDAPKPPGSVLRAKWQVLVMFARTRAAIREGVAVYDIPVERLAQEGYLTGWEFQKVEAALVAVPAAAAAILADLFSANITATGMEKWFERILTPSYIAVIPWISFVFARFAGHWSLLSAERSPDRVIRATRAYVYISNSYGLLFDLLWAIAIAAYSIAETVFMRALPGEGFVFLALLVYLTAQEIPQRLFLANGYDVARISSSSSASMSLNLTLGATANDYDDAALRSLWRHWRVVNGVLIPVLFFLFWLVLVVAAAVAALLITFLFE
jgi:hypothetical protein